uniref:Uncharacterized protein n=1 Tax=Arundo donax TaxID=35708 RepID=A0A0A9GY32_ARUDO
MDLTEKSCRASFLFDEEEAEEQQQEEAEEQQRKKGEEQRAKTKKPVPETPYRSISIPELGTRSREERTRCTIL